MVIAASYELSTLDRAERIALAAAFYRARLLDPDQNVLVDDAVEELVSHGLENHDAVILNYDEACVVLDRLDIVIESQRNEAPELRAVARKMSAIIQGKAV